MKKVRARWLRYGAVAMVLGAPQAVLGSPPGAPNPGTPPPTTTPETPGSAAKPADPVAERSHALREAADLLDKAGAARTRGSRNFAEQLFSSAELIVGPDSLADLSPLFREGAPPRINTPLKEAPKDAAPQPTTVGNSDEEEPAAKPQKGALSGVLQFEGGGEGVGVVMLEPASGKFRRRRPQQRVVEQRNRQFGPHVLVVPVGSTVAFPNFDTIFHNVFSRSEAKAFDLGLYKAGQEREVTFDKEGIVRLGCNLHANMQAYLVVSASPYYTVTDATGRFSFRSLEPGKYRLRAWSERSSQMTTREIEIKPDKNMINLSLVADTAAGLGPDKFGVPRGKKP
jgi:plastocyanin